MITCSCGREQSMPTYPHKDNLYHVCFLADNMVAVTVKCECEKHLTTTYSLVKIETVEE